MEIVVSSVTQTDLYGVFFPAQMKTWQHDTCFGASMVVVDACETTIFDVLIWSHPTETTNKPIMLFRLPGGNTHVSELLRWWCGFSFFQWRI